MTLDEKVNYQLQNFRSHQYLQFWYKVCHPRSHEKIMKFCVRSFVGRVMPSPSLKIICRGGYIYVGGRWRHPPVEMNFQDKFFYPILENTKCSYKSFCKTSAKF